MESRGFRYKEFADRPRADRGPSARDVCPTDHMRVRDMGTHVSV
jgi:hypothetical protein